MEPLFADRITDVPKSFIREILKIAVSPDIISFAGGLPNRELFPVSALQEASNRVFESQGCDALQYSSTEGYLPLRQYIAAQYAKKGLEVDPNLILITSGSQQGLDLLAKSLVNEGDNVIIEEPGYLGAIQSLSVYRAKFNTVSLTKDGLDTDKLKEITRNCFSKLMYTVPNFQNPTGLTYSKECREKVAAILSETYTYLIEDDPYGSLRYSGEELPSFKELLPRRTVLLGSFSKTAVPGFRLGWLVSPCAKLYEKVVIAKQAADLHTSSFIQMAMYNYLTNNNPDDHIALIREVYGRQCRTMLAAIDKHFPKKVTVTRPEGGMFLWAELPGGLESMELFDMAIARNVAFVPGTPFYVNPEIGRGTMRLNFSCVDEKAINEGIERLGGAIRELMAKYSIAE